MRLLTAASEVRLWNVDSLSGVSQLRSANSWNPFLPNDGVGACAWSNDNSVLALASRSTDDTRIIAFRVDAETVRCEATVEEHASTISLSSSGRYAVCGTEQGKVFIVDLKTGRTKRKFEIPATQADEPVGSGCAVTCSAFNGKDALVVAGTERGTLHIFNVQTQFAYAPLMHSNSSHQSVVAVQHFAFSTHSPALLAAAYDDGSFSFWNAAERTLVGHVERAHAGASTAVCFSPVSDQLALSVGVDGRVALYDVGGRRRIALVRAGPDGAPLAGVDLFADGYTLVCATQLGAVHFFDLRSLSVGGDGAVEPLCSVPKAHAAPVRFCRFERVVPDCGNDSAASGATLQSTLDADVSGDLNNNRSGCNAALDAISPLRADASDPAHTSDSLTMTVRSRVSDVAACMSEERCLRNLYREFRFANESQSPSVHEPMQTPVLPSNRSRSRSADRRVTPASISTSTAEPRLQDVAESSALAERPALLDADLGRVLGRLGALEERLEAAEERLRSETRNAHLDFILLIREQNERIDEVLAHLRMQNDFREENGRLKREIAELRKMY